jgi:hypothetical protein
MTPDEVKNHPLFKKLTDAQQTFVAELIANGDDKVKAGHKAWKCNSDDSARALANRAMKNPNIAWLVDSYFESDPESMAFTRETALSFAAKKARTASDPKMALDYFKIAVEMEGWRVKPAEQPIPLEVKLDPANDTITI